MADDLFEKRLTQGMFADIFDPERSGIGVETFIEQRRSFLSEGGDLSNETINLAIRESLLHKSRPGELRADKQRVQYGETHDDKRARIAESETFFKKHHIERPMSFGQLAEQIRNEEKEQPEKEPDAEPEEAAVFGLKPPDDVELPRATDDLIRGMIEDQGPTGAEFAASLKEFTQQQEGERANLAEEIQGTPEEPQPRSFAQRRESAQRNTPPGFEPQIQMQNLAGRDIPAPAAPPPAAGAAPQPQAGGGQAGNVEMVRLLNSIADSLSSLVELAGKTNTKLDEIKQALENVGTLGP